MAVTTTSAALAATPATTTAQPTQGGPSADYNMFLKLLTTQMQNQDPLDPMDSTEYASQLAQFSQVEQTTQQTGTLKDILAQLTTQNMAQASGFIGHVGQFSSSTAGLTADTAANWGYTASRGVSSLTATITDASGKTVSTASLDPATSGNYTWNGALADGLKATAGAYTLSLVGVDASGQNVPVAITTSGKVSEVVGANGALTLGVNGVQVPLALLVKLQAAG